MKMFFQKRLGATSEPRKTLSGDLNNGGENCTTKTTILEKLSRLSSSNNMEKTAGGKPNLKIIIPN
jgi:hypothetical protein